MNVLKINRIESVLKLKENEKILDYKLTRLTAAGENYGSLMMSLDVTLNNSKKLALIAKFIPPNDLLQQYFNTQLTFKNEIAFYNTILPILQNFQATQGCKKIINFFPKFYGGRTSLNPNSEEVDGDAVLILENLKILNFTNIDRLIGFDYETSKIILEDVAKFHATSLALKLLRPGLFDTIRPYLARLRREDKLRISIISEVMHLIEDIPELQQDLERIQTAMNLAPFESSRELFSTITHNDLWVNNAMVKLNADGRVVENIIVDFQLCDYSSAMKDVLFFIFTSVQISVIRQHYDDLIQHYYHAFLGVLAELKCDTSLFSNEALLDEIAYEAKHSQFYHVMNMIAPILAEKGSIKELAEITMDDFEPRDCTELQKERFIFVAKEFIKRNWI